MENMQTPMRDVPLSRLAARRKQRRRDYRIGLLLCACACALAVGLFALWFFCTSSGTKYRYLLADTLIATQHRHWAKYLLGQKGLDRRVEEIWRQFDEWAEVAINEPPAAEEPADAEPPPPEPAAPKPLVEIEPVEGKNFKGYLLIVNDPKKLRIAVTGKKGKGEKVTSMVQRLGAVAGVNAGGFIDPNWQGNGFQPDGIVMSGGNIFYNDAGMDTPQHIVGIDKDGRMVAGKYSANELLQMGVQEAVSFAPRFIVNGEGLIKSAAQGWGIAPRTCMAQKEDGTIMFAIIDGRQPGYSIGATLYDVQNLFLERGAVIAANLDGGSSTVLVYENKIVNRPASEYGERYLPTAWLVFEHPEQADIRNIWEGLDISEIDPSKW
jgi:exopolysaccharide biosynthesis protein